MKLVFSVYDSKAEAFLQPFFTDASGVAVRMFQSAVADGNHDFNKYAEDFTLYEIGGFDEASGQLMSHDSPRSVVRAAALKAAKENGGV